MSIFTKSDAIISINPDSQFSYYHSPRDEIKWHSSDIPQPTEEELAAEILRLQTEHNAQAYARKRKAEYDALNQLEMQFDDKEDGTTTWEDAIKAIKTKYPKG